MNLGILRRLLAVISISGSCLAADHYVREGASCTVNCNSWSNASGHLTTALSSASRGDTIWVGDGTYGGRVRFNVAPNGSTLITIKKATVSSHGTSTGWSDSYGDGVALFTDGWSFDTGYWVVDGQVGQGATTLSGVAGTPDYVGYGFAILKTSTKNFDSCMFIGGDPPKSTPNITVRHTRCGYLNTPGTLAQWGYAQDGVWMGNSNDITLSYMWIHDVGRVSVYQDRGNRMTIEHSVIERNGHYAAAGGRVPPGSGDFEHSEISAMWHGGKDLVWRYNVIRDWRSTGGLILMGTVAPTLYVYGNVFTNTGYWRSQGGAHGFVNGLDTNQTREASVWVYNNTFVNSTYSAALLTEGNYTTRVVRNNIFYNAPVLTSAPTSSHNWWFNSGTQVGTNNQTGSGDPFVNLSNNDWRLSAATNAGDATIGSNYNTDPLGNTRGVDGVWDRGAFEFSNANSIQAPQPPSTVTATVSTTTILP